MASIDCKTYVHEVKQRQHTDYSIKFEHGLVSWFTSTSSLSLVIPNMLEMNLGVFKNKRGNVTRTLFNATSTKGEPVKHFKVETQVLTADQATRAYNRDNLPKYMQLCLTNNWIKSQNDLYLLFKITHSQTSFISPSLKNCLAFIYKQFDKKVPRSKTMGKVEEWFGLDTIEVDISEPVVDSKQSALDKFFLNLNFFLKKNDPNNSAAHEALVTAINGFNGELQFAMPYFRSHMRATLSDPLWGALRMRLQRGLPELLPGSFATIQESTSWSALNDPNYWSQDQRAEFGDQVHELWTNNIQNPEWRQRWYNNFMSGRWSDEQRQAHSDYMVQRWSLVERSPAAKTFYRKVWSTPDGLERLTKSVSRGTLVRLIDENMAMNIFGEADVGDMKLMCGNVFPKIYVRGYERKSLELINSILSLSETFVPIKGDYFFEVTDSCDQETARHLASSLAASTIPYQFGGKFRKHLLDHELPALGISQVVAFLTSLFPQAANGINAELKHMANTFDFNQIQLQVETKAIFSLVRGGMVHKHIAKGISVMNNPPKHGVKDFLCFYRTCS